MLPSAGGVVLAATLALVLACCAAPRPPFEGPPFMNPDLPVEDRVTDLLERMTLEEKAGQMGNEAPAIPRLGIPAYDWWNEALHGVARAGRATVFPQAIGLAATWDTDLVFRLATATSLEARAKHAASVREGHRGIYEGLTFFSPNINIFRDPRWGRGMETYGEDPFLSGRMAVQFVRGLQGDDPAYLRSVATAKHYAVHSGPEPDRHGFDAVVSERDLRETYLPAFEAAVTDGGAVSVMCAYNRVYGDPACASRRLLRDILRGEWGFDGYVVSDCWAITDIYDGHDVAEDEVEAAARSLRAGTDLACGPEYRSLPEAVARGLVTEAEVDTALARLLRTRIRLGLLDPPGRVPFSNVGPGTIDSEAHRELAREVARKSMVLLKNEGRLLPLGPDVGRIAVIGPTADDVELLLGNYNGTPAAPVTPLAGIRDAAAGRGLEVAYARGADLAPGLASLVPVPATRLEDLTARYYANPDLSGDPFAARTESVLEHQWWRDPPLEGMPADGFAVRWTGSLAAPSTGRYTLGLRAIGTARLFLDDSLIVELSDRHVVLTRSADVELRAGDSHDLRVEFSDRRADASIQLLWAPPAPDALADAVAAAREADVALLFLGLSPRLEGEEMRVQVPGFEGGDRVRLDLPDTQQELLRRVAATGTPTAVVLLSGSALAIPWAAENVPAILQAWYPGQAAGDALADIVFGDASPGGRLPVTFYRSVEDLPPFPDYDMAGRTYRYFGGRALFPFGHGLSYARFRYRDLRVPQRAEAGEAVEVSVEVENAGPVPADEVVQVYVTDVEATVPVPVRSLAGFRRVTLAPGERSRVSFSLDPRAFSLIDADGGRVVEPGEFEISVGGKQPGQTGVADAPTTEVVTGHLEVTARRR
ncbi:MAG: glycoside hydrolase family 3 C-terminal domain-containing protein [Gemmatimonadota bacterium]|jgi:beta-glucosidase